MGHILHAGICSMHEYAIVMHTKPYSLCLDIHGNNTVSHYKVSLYYSMQCTKAPLILSVTTTLRLCNSYNQFSTYSYSDVSVFS